MKKFITMEQALQQDGREKIEEREKDEKEKEWAEKEKDQENRDNMFSP